MQTSAVIPFGWARAAEAGCRFRRATDADLTFLGRLYASTRTDELSVAPWSEAEKADFLDRQFRAQHAHYQKYYPNTDWLVIEHVERFPATACPALDAGWTPVRVKKTRQNKNLGPRSDSIGTEQAPGEDIGRLYIERWPTQHRIIDIAFLPEHRGKGLGEALLRDLLDEAAAAAKDVSIHVEKLNPAMRLYRRLGFVTEEDKGVYDLMRWMAGAT
jgi:ribosomal protein S18 acetylase RimI-like enzyme